jgi:hypothetical protein
MDDNLKDMEFTVKITIPSYSKEIAHFYLNSILEELKRKKDLINIKDFKIISD